MIASIAIENDCTLVSNNIVIPNFLLSTQRGSNEGQDGWVWSLKP